MNTVEDNEINPLDLQLLHIEIHWSILMKLNSPSHTPDS